ncbi:MAG: sialate O-acetylesterase [Gammaproteobacteria bacterium]|nr:sialate O-acetylesterase [Gammaproteobacteria bacterium]MDH3480897.1 sialate O-acetylesterase [Gammaproteobacteria bacterium]
MKTNTRCLVIAGFMLLQCGCATVEQQPTIYRLYFLGGQSNMEGFGYVEELPGAIATSSEHVMIFAGQMALDNETHGGVGVWQPLEPGYGTGFRSDGKTNRLSDRFGPELTFGRTMAAHSPGSKIAIIKYALGGSGLAEGVGYGNWYPDFSVGAGLNQYDHALKTMRNAFSHSDIDGDGVADRLVPSGIVWMQGEADAYDSQAAADEYRANIERLMGLLRAALRVDDLPVVIGKITDSGMADDGSVMDYIATVQQAQQDYVDSDACAAYVTVTDGLAYLDDGWHYDTDGFIRMGTAFAEAMIALEKGCAPAVH